MNPMKNKVTLGQLLDLIDYNREGDRFIDIMTENGELDARLRTNSEFLAAKEERKINSMDIEKIKLQIWLEEEE